MSEIRQWLEELGLVQYADAFAENEIGMDLLHSLDHEVLKDLGVNVGGDRRLHHLEVFLPTVGGIVTQNDLAVARAVDLDARIVPPRLRCAAVAEQHGAIRDPQQFGGSAVIGGVEPEGLARHARGCEGFDDP